MVFWGELRATGITFDETAAGFLREAVPSGVINVIANERDERDEREYRAKLRTGRTATELQLCRYWLTLPSEGS